MNKATVFIWVYALPIPLFCAMWFCWYQQTQNHWFTSYVMTLPVIYGYLVPGIATNVMKKWRFRGPFRMGNYYVHHGFKYASHMSSFFYIGFSLVSLFFSSRQSPLFIVCVVAVTSIIHSLILWFHDRQLMEKGMLEMNLKSSKAQVSLSKITFSYAPVSFFLIGATYTSTGLIAYREFVILGNMNSWTLQWLFALGLALLVVIPSAAYGILEKQFMK